ncbi:hypothetical protein HDR58_01680 [bacterium]|nr:hypothetical protein [bacterium]
MLVKYENFLKEFDKNIAALFENQKQYIKCKKGCSKCCEKGEYPFSQLEFAYLTKGFINLSENRKILVQQNIRNLVMDKKEFNGERFEHKCPFLINNECSVYQYRGLICRTYGICYYDDENKYVRLPDCVYNGLNYSEQYDKESKSLNIEDVPNVNLRIDKIFESDLAKSYELNYGEIRPMLEWLEQK